MVKLRIERIKNGDTVSGVTFRNWSDSLSSAEFAAASAYARSWLKAPGYSVRVTAVDWQGYTTVGRAHDLVALGRLMVMARVLVC